MIKCFVFILLNKKRERIKFICSSVDNYLMSSFVYVPYCMTEELKTSIAMNVGKRRGDRSHALSTGDTEWAPHVPTLPFAQRHLTVHVERTTHAHAHLDSWTTRPINSPFLSPTGTQTKSLKTHNMLKNEKTTGHMRWLTTSDTNRTAHISTGNATRRIFFYFSAAFDVHVNFWNRKMSSICCSWLATVYRNACDAKVLFLQLLFGNFIDVNSNLLFQHPLDFLSLTRRR